MNGAYIPPIIIQYLPIYEELENSFTGIKDSTIQKKTDQRFISEKVINDSYQRISDDRLMNIIEYFKWSLIFLEDSVSLQTVDFPKQINWCQIDASELPSA